MDAKVENSVACHRIPKIREVCVNEGQRPAFAGERTFESGNDCHIAFGMDVNEKDTEGPLSVKSPNDSGLEFPKL